VGILRVSNFLGTVVAMALLAAGAPASAAGTGPLVLGAASLQESLNAAADAWAAKGHARPVISLAASSALAHQIEAGAPADVFISADEKWMDDVAGKGLIRAASRVDLLTNSLVLVAPVDSKVKLKIVKGFPLAQALGDSKLATGTVNAVPAGIYARQALIALGVWDQVSGKIAGTDSVRSALALVKRGEATLGVVYGTDAKAEPGVRVVDVFPAASHDPIRYPAAVLTASTNPDAAGFSKFLQSGAGKAIFRRFGFGV
jgi:molybdate transport system substrate-binding protein